MFQAFDGRKLFQQSTRFPRGKRLDSASREVAMKELINQLLNTITTERDSSSASVSTRTQGPVRSTNTYINVEGNATFFNNSNIIENIQKDIRNIDGSKKKRLVFMVEGKEVFPEEGKVYTLKGRGKSKASYMYKNDLIYVEYTTPDGKITTYNVLDREGNLVDYKLPFKLEEFTLNIPNDLEVQRQSTTLPNGYKEIHIELKWDRSFDVLVDSTGKLQQFSCKGGAIIDPRSKTISPRVEENEQR
jgi:hypothetical protein